MLAEEEEEDEETILRKCKEKYMSPPNESNPIVFFDITIGTTKVGRIIMELFADICPKTAENFRQFCTGEYKSSGNPQGYKNSSFHRILPNTLIQGGDFVARNGKGVTSIYNDRPFHDENFKLRHMCGGLLSMANSGPDTNGCQFFITCVATGWLDKSHVVFGRVILGMEIVNMIAGVQTDHETKQPTTPVIISECGQI